MSPIPCIPIALRIRAGRIPVHWEIREHTIHEVRDVDGRVLTPGGIERVFWPQVQKTKWDDVEVDEVEDPLDLRNHLFHLFNAEWNELKVLAFLERVGAWRIVDDGDPRIDVWAQGTFTDIVFAHREATGIRVLPITLEELRQETEYWYRLLGSLGNHSKLRSAFKQAPPRDARPLDHLLFTGHTRFSNTLQVSLEWHGKDPYAVVETITANELLIAAAWADVAGRAERQVCARCATRFTWPRKKKHCRWECGHLDAVKRYKRKRTLENRKAKARDTLR